MCSSSWIESSYSKLCMQEEPMMKEAQYGALPFLYIAFGASDVSRKLVSD